MANGPPPPAPPPGDEDPRPDAGARRHKGGYDPSADKYGDLPRVDVTVPDDLSELDDDVAAYRREQRLAARRARFRWFGATGRRRGRASGPSGPLVVASLVVVGIIGALLSVFVPRGRPATAPAARPLAATSQAPGTTGGLLPDIAVIGPSGRRSVRDFRPALLVLMPRPCACADSVRDIAGQARETRPLATYLVAAGRRDPQFERLLRRPTGRGRTIGLLDERGELARVYGGSATLPTLVLVAADGRVAAPARTYRPGDRLETWLGALPAAG